MQFCLGQLLVLLVLICLSCPDTGLQRILSSTLVHQVYVRYYPHPPLTVKIKCHVKLACNIQVAKKE